jgi:2',3'-cyclic-nucleotide 2'-phosphodiesterase (5'-nucleotidase family)
MMLIRTVAAAAAVTLAACIPVAVDPAPLRLSIVGTSDLHGGVLADDTGRGGLALLAGYLQNLRAAREADGGRVLLIDAGDLFQGTLESNLNEGAVVVSAYNALGYTASAIGNHEFDFGPVGEAATPRTTRDDPRGALKARAAGARFPFLAANIIDESTGRPIAWANVKPSVIVDAAGIRVGIVGLTTAATLTLTIAANTKGLAIAPLAESLEKEAARLRREGAAIIIATAHAGGRCSAFDNPADVSSCEPDSEIFTVARALPPGLVDVIVAGHRHQGIAHEVAGIAVISAYSSGRAFGRVDLIVDRPSGRVKSRRIFPPHDVCASEEPVSGKCAAPGSASSAIASYEGRPVRSSAEIASILAPAVARARELKEKPLGATLEGAFPHAVTQESALGNLIADWMRGVAPQADVALTNGGGLRADVAAGPLTYGRLYEVMPFDNQVALLRLTGAELRTAVKNNLQQRGSLMILSGVRVAATCQGGELRVALRREAGAEIKDDEPLTIVTSDFLATGGDGFLTAIPQLDGRTSFPGTLVREEIARFLTGSPRIWRASDLLGPANRRLGYPGPRPVRCAGL